MNIKTYMISFAAFALICFQSLAGNLQIDDKENNYFKDRVVNSNTENELVPFVGNTKIKPSKVKDTREKVWSAWKDVNNDIEQLPDFSLSSEESPVLHHWELIDEDPMPFYLLKKGDNSIQKKPLFLNLHGSGPKTHEFKAALMLSKMYDDSPSLYFIPQIPNERRYRWWFQPVQNAWERMFRLSMLNDEVDANKIFILGISEGGYGSQRLGAYYADYLAGVGPMAGGEPLKNAPPLNYRHVAFSFHTGEHDAGFGRNTLTALAGNVFDSLATKYPGEYIHNVVIHKDKGHSVDYTLTTPWLVKHHRTTSPMDISWVYFPMHNRYRKGFYNVGITKFPNLKEEDKFNRILFDIHFNKKENLIDLDAQLMSDEMTELKEINNGQIAIFLDDRYIDYSKKVKVKYKGKIVHNAKVKLNEETLIESCALFGDPERLYPAKIVVDL